MEKTRPYAEDDFYQELEESFCKYLKCVWEKLKKQKQDYKIKTIFTAVALIKGTATSTTG